MFKFPVLLFTQCMIMVEVRDKTILGKMSIWKRKESELSNRKSFAGPLPKDLVPFFSTTTHSKAFSNIFSKDRKSRKWVIYCEKSHSLILIHLPNSQLVIVNIPKDSLGWCGISQPEIVSRSASEHRVII